MGKKSRAKASNQGMNRKAAAEANRQKEVYRLVAELVEKCSKPPESGTLDWDEYISMHDILQRIIVLQKGSQMTKKSRRAENFASFMNWMENNDVDISNVEIVEERAEDFGLKAKRDIDENSLFLSIPRTLMMTTETASQVHGLGTLAKEDQILRNMPNVLLALHLLSERSKRDSFWKPYIRILPTEFTTVLYYSVEDMALLKGSPAQYDAVMLCRNIARQYGYFYKLFRVFSTTAESFLTGEFTYEDYRWAVSAVMTRQNQIPSQAKPAASSESTTTVPATTDNQSLTVNALIPLWDMANHTQGQITTDYSHESQCSECYALRTYRAGDTVHIFYGARANAEFLVHSGFVYDDNLHDYLGIKLGISKSDPVGRHKIRKLMESGLPSSQFFPLHRGPQPVSKELLCFLRVFSMTEEEITAHDDDPVDDYDEWLLALKKPDVLVSKENEMKSWSFLETRTALLLRAYPTTLEEDEKRLESPNTSSQARIATQLLIQEKKLLVNAAEFAAVKKQNLAETLPSQVEEKLDLMSLDGCRGN